MAFQGLLPPAHHHSCLHLAASWLDELFAYLLTQRQGLCTHNQRNNHKTFLQARVWLIAVPQVRSRPLSHY